MISFTSLEFIFRFLPIFLIIYYIIPARFRNAFSTIASLIFYAFGEPVYIIVLILLTIFNYLISNKVYDNKKSKKYMLSAMIMDIVALAVFKIISVIYGVSVFPIGLSFYIFKMISYQADIYMGKISNKPSFWEVTAYFTMFPQITQGPIMRYEEGQMQVNKNFSWDNIEEGLKYFIIGFAMKTILADRIGILFNDLSMYGYESISTPLAWMGAFAYSFELYYDFWGYSLMASGILMMMGYRFIRNFDNPYASRSVSEFYRRWHMTLGNFFKDYIYFPMGGSKCSKGRMVLNLAVVWILTGLWHGNGINFLLWGVALGVIIILEKLFYGRKLKSIPIIGHIYVLFLIPLSWMIFAINSLDDMVVYFGRLFPFGANTSVGAGNEDVQRYISSYGGLFIIAVVLCIPFVSSLYNKYKKSMIVSFGLIILFWYGIYYSAVSSGNPFMYLKF